MDTIAPPVRSDVVTVPTAPRPTAIPTRVRFSEVLAGSARALVSGAQAAIRILPGAPLIAVAVRGGAGLSSTTSATVALPGSGTLSTTPGAAPEGPGGAGAAILPGGTGTASASSDGGIESSMAQAEQMNLYYLQVQEEVNSQNRTFTALSNVLEVEHSTAKSAIANIH